MQNNRSLYISLIISGSETVAKDNKKKRFCKMLVHLEQFYSLDIYLLILPQESNYLAKICPGSTLTYFFVTRHFILPRVIKDHMVPFTILTFKTPVPNLQRWLHSFWHIPLLSFSFLFHSFFIRNVWSSEIASPDQEEESKKSWLHMRQKIPFYSSSLAVKGWSMINEVNK